jgi:acyl carrier protein
MSCSDFFTLFQQAVVEVNGSKPVNFDRATVISSLGLDSVAVIELVGYLEEKLHIRIPDEELARAQTVGDLDELVKRLTAKEVP